MFQAKREWTWDEEAECEYRAKREKLTVMGYPTDEDVCRYFAESGVHGVEPNDLRPIMLDTITASPFDRVMRSLR